MIELPLTKIENIVAGQGLAIGGDLELNLGHGKLEVPINHVCRKVKSTVGFTSPVYGDVI